MTDAARGGKIALKFSGTTGRYSYQPHLVARRRHNSGANQPLYAAA
ncbi:hypothetical protein KCP78_15685 [Salmonella enterica subsp. enterica]|nr:hypothetical protein KCP78_15685 [Salmonella enterica subsp. enterica]